MDQQIDLTIRDLHSCLTDNDSTVELHSADIAALCTSVQSLAKRLWACEELLAFHCGYEADDLRWIATGGKVDEDSHEIDAPGVAVPGD